ncbi:MAG TPA: restriction endonuclease subunit S [Methanoregulaceae archaeon]|nr:restriction endonuclease subunit S [Methanoregulaceae archaeon]HQN89118.1 restriction endonuclease subunit S [Methanoregulaceae archaeon]HQP83107.1 restriction endonuclease subunit S [Methanoregulaceae archaeon]
MSEEVVKPGYKKTEVGVIPEDWKFMRFEDVMTGFFSGQTPSRLKPEYYKGEIPWITSTELNYNIITDTNERITESAVKSKNLKKLPKGTFLFAITGLEAEGTRGKCALTGIEATTNQSCMALFPNRELITLYLFYYYEKFGDWYAINYCQGTKQQSYTGKTAKKLPIAYPPSITEQRAIAAALSDADGLIGALETLIAKKRAIKQAAMQQLLTGRTRLPGFAKSSGYKKTEVGVIPEDWDLGTLKKFSLTRDNPIQTGPFGAQLHSYDYVNEGIPLILINNIVNGKISTAGIPKITSHKAIALSKYRIKVGDIVFSRVGAVGRTALIEVGEAGWLISGQMLRIRLENHEINNKFLYYFTLTPEFQKQLISETVGTTRMSINTEILGKLLIIAPSPCEQRAIATVLSDMDAEITALEQRLEKTQQIKQGMMQQLLTGCIRLPALN